MPNIHLTPFERLMLSMQLRRMAEEVPNNPRYAHGAEIIESGYTCLYDDVFGITSEGELDASVQNEVFDILIMFRALHPGHAVGADWDPDGNFYYQKFRGFDGNAGTGHYGFADFLINTFGRFSESRGETNSHSSSTLSIYRDMLARWQQLGRPNDMTEAQIRSVLNDD